MGLEANRQLKDSIMNSPKRNWHRIENVQAADTAPQMAGG